MTLWLQENPCSHQYNKQFLKENIFVMLLNAIQIERFSYTKCITVVCLQSYPCGLKGACQSKIKGNVPVRLKSVK